MEPHEADELMRTLVRIAAHQDVINEKQDITNQRLALAIERLEATTARIEVTLTAIKDILGRSNGR